MYYLSKRGDHVRLRELSQTKLALGGDVLLALVTDISFAKAEKIFNKLWLEVYKFEKRFSRFLPSSELSEFNRQAGLKLFISPEFNELLKAAKAFGHETNGLYNPFILPALQRAGYKQSAARGYENDPQEDYSKKRVVSIDKLTIGDCWATIPYGTAIDMGGCGKGFLADKLVEILNKDSIKGYWLSLGGDVVTKGYDQDGRNITISIQNAENLTANSNYLVVCPKELMAVATSGTFRRNNQTQAKRWHHIIDPVTLKPAVTDIRLATVCAGKAVRADVLASCAVILGSQKAPAFLKKHGVTSALLQGVDEKGAVFIKKFGSLIKNTRTAKELQHA